MTRIGSVFTAGALLAIGAWAQPGMPQPGEQQDAIRTRMDFANVLRRYPPSLRTVLALDPTLLTNQAYLGSYPAVASYLNRHPEIARNPTYFIGEAQNNKSYEPPPQSNNNPEIAAMLVFLGVVSVVIWLIRTITDYRRWNRLTKIQTDVHTRLIERFTSNEELLAYIQSPAGSKFLESSPISLDPKPREMAAPVARIMWSGQAGLVLTAAGIGLHFASSRSQEVVVLSALAIALGIGFVLSAGVSYMISRKLGLIAPANTE